MATTVFDRIQYLAEACEELHKRLEEAREAIPEEEFEQLLDGPFGDILCAAMDVEDSWQRCNDL